MPAITPPFPVPLPPWARWGLRALPLVWAVAGELLDYAGTVATAGDLQWRRAAVHWERGQTSPTPEDDAICTFDFANLTNGELDTSWDAGDYATLDAAFTTFLTSVAAIQGNAYRASRIDYYRMQFASPMTELRRFVPTGPPEHTATLNIPGGATGDILPPQVAFGVTERTSIPRHWGRFYLPGFAESTTSGNGGRWGSGTVSSVASYTETLYNTCQAAELFPVVVSTQTDKVLAGSLIGVSEIQVDNIPDIIRRRRHDLSTQTVRLPL